MYGDYDTYRNYMPSRRNSRTPEPSAIPGRTSHWPGDPPMLSLAFAAAPRRVPPDTQLKPPEPQVDPLDWIGTIDDAEHILVLGGYGPGLMCALLRAGAAHVTHLCSHERPEAGSASLVIVPHVPSLDWLATAMPSIRRALAADGRLIIRGGRQFNFQIDARRMLTLYGFTAIRANDTAEGQVLGATIRAPSIHQTV
jgi:hypothetical protein